MGIDSLKSGVSSLVPTLQQKVKEKVADVKTAVADVKSAVAASVPAKAYTAFVDVAKKPLSITGKYKPPEVSETVRSDLAASVASIRTLANSGMVGASLVSAPVSDPKKVDGVKAAIGENDDKSIRDAIIANPSSLNDLTPSEKGKALKRLEEGRVSGGDAYAMKLIVNSCTTKEELRAVVAKASGNDPPSQPDFHKFDKQIQKHCGDPYLIADKLNPDNTELRTEKQVEQRAADAKKSADALDPNPSGSIHREHIWDPSKTKYVDKSLSEQKLEKEINVFVDEASASARGSDAEVKKLVSEAKSSASEMDPAHGGDLMLRTADKLAAAGRKAEARELLQEVKQGSTANTTVDLAGKYSGGVNQTKAPNGNTVSVEPGGINETLGTVADRRLAQLDQVDKMEKTLGRKVDPYDVGALRDYFQKVKADGGMKAAGQEYNQYLQNFTKHPGGVENNWVQNKADLDDPTKMASVMKNQTRDASGRMLLDCEGTTFLTGQIFGAKPSTAGNEVWFTADQQHIAATVIDPKTGEGFHVNTAKSRKEYVTEIPKPTPKNENDRKAVAWGFFSHNGEAGKQGMPGGSFIPGKDYALTRKVEEARMTD